ncbi:MAG: SDR family oxidoreductase [Planctomycetes bacterium]|nr:SDR family oxidoreductase [Planctomycetota bacterium]
MGGLAGRTAIVTGGSSGIGRAIALRFAGAGAQVTVAARGRARCEETVREIERAGGRACAAAADVACEADVERLVAETVARWGGLDLMVANAGIGVWGPAEELALADWERVLAVDLTGVFLCARAAFRQMRRQGRGGTILAVASVAGVDAWSGTAAYSAAKFGVRGFMKALSDEGEEHGIKVSTVCPGMVDTPMIGAEGEEKAELIAPEDVADAALYLATLGRNVVVHDLVLDRRGSGR